MKSHYHLQAIGDELKEGDAVWLYNPQRKKGVSPKLSRLWQGPYVVMRKLNDLVYRIQLGPRQKPKVVHRNRLWTYNERHSPTWHLSKAKKFLLKHFPESNLQQRIAIKKRLQKMLLKRCPLHHSGEAAELVSLQLITTHQSKEGRV